MLASRWLAEPDAWDATYVVEKYGRRYVFHLVVLRNSLKAWCGYLGYRANLPVSDEGWRVVESAAHRGECTGAFRATADGRAPETLRIPWPGYLYMGFDCSRIGDWTPRNAPLHLSAAMYRPLDYAQGRLHEMADIFVEQFDPLVAAMLARAQAAADAEEAADCAVGPEPLL